MGQDSTKIASYIRVYRNVVLKPHCGIPFFYVEFRVNLGFFLLSCCWQTAVPEYD